MFRGFYGALTGPERCSHNLRTSVPGQSRICLVCECAKLDDLLLTECSGNKRLPCAYVDHIIHTFRIINSTLDAPIQTNLDEILTPVLKTALGLLKIHRDDVGAVVSQAVDKICPKAPITLLEYFLRNLSAQILEKTSFGNLESLSVLIRRKECLNSFLKSHSTTVYPKLFQELEEHVGNIRKYLACTAIPINTMREIGLTNEKQSLSSLQILAKILDVLETTCGTDVSVIITHQGYSSSQSSQFLSPEGFPIFDQYRKSLIITCMDFLKSFIFHGTNPDLVVVSTKVLRFLGKLQQNPDTLRCIFCDKTGIAFGSLIKELLLSRSVDIQTATLSLVLRMLTTYKSVMEDGKTNKEFIVNMPSVMLEVDLVGFIKDAINTSNEALFRTTIEVLNQIISIPVFRSRQIMVSVLESTLRTSAVRISDIIDVTTYESLNKLVLNTLKNLSSNIPPTIQRQLIYLFERLPSTCTSLEILPWTKLLVFCSDAEVQPNILSIFTKFVQQGKILGSQHCYDVTLLKCVLLIAYALMKCIQTRMERSYSPVNVQIPTDDGLTKQLLHCLMDDCFLPSVIALVRYGKSEDCDYIAIMLELLLNYPTHHLTSSYNSREYHAPLRCKVGFESDSADREQNNGQNVEYEIHLDLDWFMKDDEGKACWTPKLLIEVLSEMRLNTEFIPNHHLFKVWNQNVANIMCVSYPTHLPQLKDIIDDYAYKNRKGLNSGCIAKDNERHIVQSILQSLNVRACEWGNLVGKCVIQKDMDSTARHQHDIILVYYFFVAQFAGKTVCNYIDGNFVERFCTFLEDCVTQHNATQEVQEFELDLLSFYFRVALMVATSLPYEEDNIMVYHHTVFVYLLQHMPPNFVKLAEKWIDRDKRAFVAVYKKGDYVYDLKTELTNTLIILAAQGNIETSKTAVALGSSKRLKPLNFQLYTVLSNFHFIFSRLRNSQNPELILQLSNLMALVINDDFLLSENSFPSVFLTELVDVLLRFKNERMIGARGLELLSKILKNGGTFKNVNDNLHQYKEFVKYLGSKIHTVDSKKFEEPIYAQTMLSQFILHNLDKFYAFNSEDTPWITWKLSSVMSYIQILPRYEILGFLIAIFKVDFKCPLIQVEELREGSSGDLKEILLNLLFNLEALTHKVILKEWTEAIWTILSELLRVAEQGKVVKDSSFCSDVLLQPWIKVLVVRLLSNCKIPSVAPLMSLEFLQKWTKMMLDELKNPNRSSFHANFLIQSYSGTFKTIQDAMKRRPALDILDSNLTESPLEEDIINLNIHEKTTLICQIVANCDSFFASLMST